MDWACTVCGHEFYTPSVPPDGSLYHCVECLQINIWRDGRLQGQTDYESYDRTSWLLRLCQPLEAQWVQTIVDRDNQIFRAREEPLIGQDKAWAEVSRGLTGLDVGITAADLVAPKEVDWAESWDEIWDDHDR